MHFVELAGYYPPDDTDRSHVINLDHATSVEFDEYVTRVNMLNSAPYIVTNPQEIEKLREAMKIGEKD